MNFRPDTRALARFARTGARRRALSCALLAGIAGLAGCTHVARSGGAEDATRADFAEYSPIQPVALSPVRLSTPVVALSDGRCQAREETPAIYEQVMGEVMVIQAQIAEDGTVIAPPVYRRAPVPKVVRERSEFIFDAVCGHQMTPEFISSLQRALAARGYFAGNVTGWIDAPTSAAILRYQTDRGLASEQLSLETARSLGLITVALSEAG